MSKGNCEILFPDFNACFSASSEFPEDALARIPEGLVSVIDEGNACFFSGLENSFPKLFDLLVTKCSRVYLLEFVSIGMSLDDFGEEHRTYCWGLKYEEKLITARIPVSDTSSEVFRSNASERLPYIPGEFASFYEKMDGISIADGIGPNGYDLPSSFGDWRELASFMEINGESPDYVDRVYEDLPESDLRTFIVCTSGDVIFCNLSGKEDDLYLLKKGDIPNYKRIENPVKELDSYFVSAIKGIPLEL